MATLPAALEWSLVADDLSTVRTARAQAEGEQAEADGYLLLAKAAELIHAKRSAAYVADSGDLDEHALHLGACIASTKANVALATSALTPPASAGVWPESTADLVAGNGGALTAYAGPSPIWDQIGKAPEDWIVESGFTKPSGLSGASNGLGSEPGNVCRFSWALLDMTGGSSYRPNGYNIDWEITDSIIELHGDQVESPIHGDVCHPFAGSGPLHFERCLLYLSGLASFKSSITAIINVEAWAGDVTFVDCAIRHDGFGGVYPIGCSANSTITFTRCELPTNWNNRYPTGQGPVTTVDCFLPDGTPIADQTLPASS